MERVSTIGIIHSGEEPRAPEQEAARLRFRQELDGSNFPRRVRSSITELFDMGRIRSLSDLSSVSDKALLRLRMVGPKALGKIRENYPVSEKG